MNAQAALLKASINADLAEINRLYKQLASYLQPLETVEQTIVVGYYLHNLYTAFENISLNVARTFENQIDDQRQWHAMLLKRMMLDIEGIRPKLYQPNTYVCLDELRRFRHVFRNAYSIALDPQRVAIVLSKAQDLQTTYEQDMNQFKQFLDSLAS